MCVRKFVSAVLFCLGLAGAAFGAFSIDPAVVTINANKGENSAWLDLVHTGGGPIAVELAVLERELDLEGEVKKDSDKTSGDFTVHPAQVILAPGERAKIQVIYKGKQKITADRAYQLFSKEVPLKLEEEGGGVRMGLTTLINYYTILAVSVGKPGKLTFVSSKQIEDGKIEVLVENKSPGRVAASNLVITVGNQKIRDFTGKGNSVMPGQKRRFTFKFDRPVTAKETSFGYQ